MAHHDWFCGRKKDVVILALTVQQFNKRILIIIGKEKFFTIHPTIENMVGTRDGNTRLSGHDYSSGRVTTVTPNE
jgi:hypothetical protein